MLKNRFENLRNYPLQTGEAPWDKSWDSDRIYPCDDCGLLRSKDEGGTIFTVCDTCWDKHYAKFKK